VHYKRSDGYFKGDKSVCGFAMIVFLLGYVAWQYIIATRQNEIEKLNLHQYKHFLHGLLFLILGLVLVPLARFWWYAAPKSRIHNNCGVSRDVIRLAMSAIGTSLPELSTCLILCGKKTI
jgi:Ca2+/Na+ antiporter